MNFLSRTSVLFPNRFLQVDTSMQNYLNLLTIIKLNPLRHKWQSPYAPTREKRQSEILELAVIHMEFLSRSQPLAWCFFWSGFFLNNITIDYSLLLWLFFLRQFQLNLSFKCRQFRLQSFQFIFFLPMLVCYLLKEWNVLGKNSICLFILFDGLWDALWWVLWSGKAERKKFRAAAIRSDRAVKPLLRQSYGSNKSSIETSLSTMLRCIPSATPKVVTKVLTNDFRIFVFSLKIAIRRRKVCS